MVDRRICSVRAMFKRNLEMLPDAASAPGPCTSVDEASEGDSKDD